MHAAKVQLKSHLDGEGGDDGLGVDEVGLAQVVEAIRAEDLCARLPPNWLPELQSAQKISLIALLDEPWSTSTIVKKPLLSILKACVLL